MSEVKKAPWFKPDSAKPVLQVNNSITQSVVPFIPQSGNAIKWYGCGPTVYDSAHLGHARAYVTFDIMRRILSDYFNYDVFYVMNITDVDDKIILRARRNYLFAEYEKAAKDVSKVIADAKDAFAFVVADAESKVNELSEKIKTAEKRYLADMEDQLQQSKLKLDIVVKERLAFEEVAAKAAELGKDAIAAILDKAKGALAAKIDNDNGAAAVDHAIFKAHTERYEKEFLEDLAALGVREVDALTRVTEYIDHIIVFVQKIIANGFAYESKGSVYFDTVAFANAKDSSGLCKHFYAKLKPTAVGNLELAAEGEGSLGSTGEKRHPNDFALWKLSRPGEPRWESPWGLGRPGWHIECSAMATDLLGTQFDIHSGGDDLKFPHHDNELAQSEAYSGCQQWINYFLHAGHLSISGLKMSKSLKNFVTIRQCLQYNTARQVRLLFLLQRWDGTMNYSDDSLKEAVTREQTLKQFFLNIQVLERAAAPVHAVSQFWSEADRTLQAQLEAAQNGVNVALCDNMNYPDAMRCLFDLVSAVNKYLAEMEKTQTAPKLLLVKRCGAFVEKMMRVFGVTRDDQASFLDMYKEGQEGNNDFACKVMDTFVDFRDKIREVAKNPELAAVGDIKGAMMKACDVLRDDVLPELGIRLEDKPTGKAVWKLDSAEEMRKQKEEKIAQQKQKQINKLASLIKNNVKAIEKHTAALVAPAAMFKTEAYSQWTEEGLPTHDAEGVELSKNQGKQVAKAHAQRAKEHGDLLALAEKAGVSAEEFVAKLKAENADLEAQLAELEQ